MLQISLSSSLELFSSEFGLFLFGYEIMSALVFAEQDFAAFRIGCYSHTRPKSFLRVGGPSRIAHHIVMEAAAGGKSRNEWAHLHGR